nr:hypothetical protein [Tanacetum cinerariifolium]
EQDVRPSDPLFPRSVYAFGGSVGGAETIIVIFGGALLWRRGRLLMLTNKGWVDGNGSNPGGGFGKLGGWVDGNGSNPGGGFGKPGGGLETRDGGDGLRQADGQLSKVEHKDHLVTLEVEEVLENSRKDGVSLSSDDEDEEETTRGEAIFFPFFVLGFLKMSRGSMKCEPSNWDNGLRICGKDMIIQTGQKHGKRHGTFAFLYDFLHSINNHRSEVKLSSNGR